MARVCVLSNVADNRETGSGFVVCKTCESLELAGETVDLLLAETWDFPFLGNRFVSYRKAFYLAWAVLKNPGKMKGYDYFVAFGAEPALAITLLRFFTRNSIKFVCATNGLEPQVRAVAKVLKKRGVHINTCPWGISSLYSRVLAHSHILLSNSRFTTKYAAEVLSLENERIIEAALPIDETFFTDHEKTSRARYSIVYCGSWIQRKGVNTLINAFEKIVSAIPQASLTVIGNADPNVACKFSEPAQARVRFIGHLDDRKEIAAIFRSSEIMIFPSHLESFGLVTLEAMASGCVVMTGDTGVACGLVDQTDIVKIDTFDSDGVAAAALALLGKSSELERLSENGKTAAKQFTTRRFQSKIKECVQLLRR